MVRRIEDQKEETKIEQIDPIAEPNVVTKNDILGIALPKKSDKLYARYDSKIVETEDDFKFQISITKTR